jgi:hypothetical protein
VSAIVLTEIDAGLAQLVRLVPVPTGPLGYGSDLWCELDFRPNLDELAGDSRLLLAQAIFHRLITPRGSLPDDLEYGRDVRALLSKGLTGADMRAEAAQLSTEVTKDDRVENCEITIAQTSLKELAITVAIEPRDPALGGFELTIGVDADGVWIEAVT